MASYFLNTQLDPGSFGVNLGSSEGDNDGAGGASSAIASGLPAGVIKKEETDFIKITKQVIQYLEGGYYSPDPKYGHPGAGDPKYKYSGETMFGIDRNYTPGSESAKATSQSKAFWAKVDANKKVGSGVWAWNYIPPDPLRNELTTLAANVIKPQYEANKKAYLKNQEIVKLIESDGRLLFNFIYACWNGPGWFAAFANEITAYYNKGNKTSEALLKWIVNRRIDPTGLAITGTYKVQKGDLAWELSNMGGVKIKKLVGVGNSFVETAKTKGLGSAIAETIVNLLRF